MELTMADGTEIKYAKGLLGESGLPTDVDRDGVEILISRVDGRRVGVCGLEVRGPCALVRSVAIEPDEQGTEHGTALVERLLERASERGVRECYLLTEDAEEFFVSLGFERTEHGGVPNAIRETSEFAAVCPASATCLHRELD
jgi:amino-acid N-acetyltransferase